MAHKIIEISENDAYYDDREHLVGMTGIAFDIDVWENGYCGCYFEFFETPSCFEKDDDGMTTFFEVKLEEVEDSK